MGKTNRERRKRRLIGIGLLIVATLLLVLLVGFFRSAGADLSPRRARGLGVVGGVIAGALARGLGVLAFVVPVAAALIGLATLARRSGRRMLAEGGLLLGTTLLLSGFFHAVPGLSEVRHTFLGGEIGDAVHGLLVGLIGGPGAFLALGGGLLLLLVALVDFEVPGRGLIERVAEWATTAFADWRERRRALAEERRKAAEAARREAARVVNVAEVGRGGRTAVRREDGKTSKGALGERQPRVAIVEPLAGARGAERAGAPSRAAASPPIAEPRVAMDEPDSAPRRARASGDGAAATGRSAASGSGVSGDARGYVLPPIDLLHDAEHSGSSITKEQLLENSRTLEAKLADFGVRASVVEVHPGPVITRYELEPAPGIKVGQIANLADDLALVMRAKRIRIVAPIPGKGAVGIEIPNPEPRTVTLKEVVASAAFQESRSPLTLGLGKDTSGAAFVTTMEEMPHLLIAGATGSGKSVSMHVLISSILLKAAPTDVRFLLIDPKMLELTVYNDIPHLMRPVVTDPREAAKGLRWVIDEMERRYKSLARAGVRNIGEFNRSLDKHAQTWGEEPAPRPLPFLVVVIDEYADLVLTLGAEVEEPIAKLAQMARAVGIHLVVATQRPSVDVITGVIKANFPSRIAFQVASKVDSRTIMDVNGAEKLLGRGDMLFLKTGKPEPDRVHGAFISNDETAAIVDFIKEQGYVAERLEIEVPGGEEGADRPFDGDSEDELFSEAVSLVVRHQLASVSMLQRRLRVGFSRAGRLMDIMERAGIVGPFEGSKAREVYVKPGELSAARQEPDE